MKNLFLKTSEFIADYSFRFFVILFAIGNLFFSIERYLAFLGVKYRFTNLINIILVISLLLIFYFLIKNNFYGINSKKYLSVFLFCVIVVGTIWIMINYPEILDYDDSRYCVDNARKLYNGDWACVGYRSYVNTYPFQLTFITYLYVLLRIFGYYNFLYAARFLNLVYVVIGYLFLYKITKLLFKNETVNNIAVSLMFLSMQYVFLCFYIYGTCISHSFAIVSIYYLLHYFKTGNKISLLPAGVSIVIACAMKNNSLIILIAEAIFLLIHFVKEKKLINFVYLLLVFIAFTISTKSLQDYYAKKTNTDYSNALPRICWIAYGLNYDIENPGGYTPEFEVYHHDNDYYTEGTVANAKWFINYVLTRFNEKPTLALRFYAQKFGVSFCEPAYGVLNPQYDELPYNKITLSIIKGDGYRLLYEIWDATASIVAIGLLSYCFTKKRNKNIYELIIGVVVFGGFCFHAIWETKALYLIQYYLFLIPLAASGLCNIYKPEN